MTDTERKQVFSRNLLNILNLKRKTQIEIATAIGVSQQTFNSWCRGVALPRMGKIQLLADYFDIDMADLIENHAAPPAPAAAPSSPDLDSLVEKYGRLNTAGKEKLQERADELIVMGYTEEEEIKKKEEA